MRIGAETIKERHPFAVLSCCYLLRNYQPGQPSLLIAHPGSRLGGHTVYFGSQTRFVSCGGVLMKDAFLYRPIDDRYGLG